MSNLPKWLQVIVWLIAVWQIGTWTGKSIRALVDHIKEHREMHRRLDGKDD